MSETAPNAESLDLSALDLSCNELFDQIPAWVSIQDRDFRVIKTSKKLLTDFGEHRLHKCYEVYKGRTEPCENCVVEQTLADGKDHKTQDVIFDKRGLPHNLLVSTRPLRNHAGEIVAVMKLFADVTAEKSLADRLHYSLMKFHNLFDNAPCFISVQDRDFRILETNQRFNESFGDGPGEHCYERYKKRQDRCQRCPVAETFEDGQVHTSEEVVVDNHGRQVHTLVYAAPLRNADGEIASVMEMSADVTEIRLLQNRLAQLGQMVGGIAHNAKNILEGLRGGVYIVNLGFRDNKQEDIRTGWDMVQRNVQRLSAVIMDMLHCAKDRSPRQLPVSLNNVLQEVLALFAPKAEGFQIKLESHVDGKVEILGEPKDLHALVANLISNAIDACNADQDDSKAHRVAARLFLDKGAAVIEVEDNGAGMDAATRNALFQGIVSTKGNAGTGLGLVMSQKVATEHGGSIVVRSEPNQGSVFTVRLPVRRPDAASS